MNTEMALVCTSTEYTVAQREWERERWRPLAVIWCRRKRICVVDLSQYYSTSNNSQMVQDVGIVGFNVSLDTL